MKAPNYPRDQRYRDDYGLTAYDAALIADDRTIAEFFDAAIAAGADPKQSFNWIMGDITAYLNENKLKIGDIAIKPTVLAEMIGLITDGTISSKIAKDILPELILKGGSIKDLVAAKGLTVLAGDALAQIIDEVIAANPKEVEQYKGGKTKLLGFFVGQVMKKTQGRAEPQSTNKLIAEKLSA